MPSGLPSSLSPLYLAPFMQTLLRILLPAFLTTWIAQTVRLVNFQVTQPPIIPENTQQCTIKLIECVPTER